MFMRDRQHRLRDPAWNNEFADQSPRRIQAVKGYVLRLGAPQLFKDVHRVRAEASHRTVV